MLNIVCRTVGMLGTCCYILWQDDRQDCIVIDPGAEAQSILEACGGRRIAAILLTHGHFDHMGAAAALLAEGTQLVIHRDDADMLDDPQKNVSWMIGQRIICPPATRLVQEGDTVDCAGITLQVLHTPGHTPGSVCYEVDSHLFTGDTLFEYGFGRTDLPGGSAAAMSVSLQRVMPMADSHSIYPGHGS